MPEVQRLPCQHSHFSQFNNILWTFGFNAVLEFAFLFLFGDGGEEVIWFGDVFGNGSAFGDDAGPEGACELESFVLFLGLFFARDVDEFVDGPCFLEAVLTAKVGGVEIHLLAGGTHHRCRLTASWSPTLVLAQHS